MSIRPESFELTQRRLPAMLRLAPWVHPQTANGNTGLLESIAPNK
jgi:hypothetical protein